MVKRYGFTPETPVQIELYASRENSACARAGCPNIGIQGVCFGQTLAAMSPRAEPFNWGNVLWHELGHVFAIQLSKNHVPRWFTEGFSEYETIVRRPEWRREEDPELLRGASRGRIPAVDAMNRAFTHATTRGHHDGLLRGEPDSGLPRRSSSASRRSSRCCRMGRGRAHAEVVKEVARHHARGARHASALGSLRGSRVTRSSTCPTFTRSRSTTRARPSNASPGTPRATSSSRAPSTPTVRRGGRGDDRRSLRVDPKSADAEFAKLELAVGNQKADDALRIATQMIADGHDGYAVRMQAAEIAQAQKDERRMKESLEAAARLDPTEDEPLAGLLELAEKRHDEAAELESAREARAARPARPQGLGPPAREALARGEWEKARQGRRERDVRRREEPEGAQALRARTREDGPLRERHLRAQQRPRLPPQARGSSRDLR